jgi:GNAT superfamily N-acetyltransferase
VRIVGPQLNCHVQCETILRAVPEWFGIESAIVDYVRNIETLPTFLALDEDDRSIGLMTVKMHFPQSADLYVLAVRKEHHRRGVGRALLDRVEEWLRGEGVRFLQVKTLAPTANYEPYDRTRRFYEAMGFTPLEIFPTLWDPRNPCLMMIKAL